MAPTEPEDNLTRISEIRKYEKKLQIGSFLSIFIVCVLIGIPLWWKTTEVYRVSLPYSSIDEQNNLEDIPILIGVEVLVAGNIRHSHQLTQQLTKLLQDTFDFDDYPDDNHHISIHKQLRVRGATEEEDGAVEGGAGGWIGIDSRLSGLRKSTSGHLTFFILSPAHFGGADDDGGNHGDDGGNHGDGGGNHGDDGGNYGDGLAMVMGLDRTAYLKFTSAGRVAEQISSLLQRFYIKRTILASAFHAKGPQMQEGASGKGSMTSLPVSAAIDTIFTLVHPDRVHVQWDVAEAFEDFLQPMLNDLKPYMTFSVRSQMIHLLSLGGSSKFSRSCDCHPLLWNQLPHLINPIEPYLASHVTDNPILNFVTYIPSQQQTPLLLFHQSGKASTTNSFLVPRWGGILIKNAPPLQDINRTGIPSQDINRIGNSKSVSINSKEVLSVFMAQLKSLIGFEKPSYYQVKSVMTLSSPKKAIPNWELDSWLLHNTLDNIATATGSMASLKQLLTLINNMIINDDVGQHVYTSVGHTAASLVRLRQADVHSAYVHSLKALQSSEKAFFDHSLLELLYFPEDQKFAIYLPLFFPLGLPILATTFQTYKYLLNIYKERQQFKL